MSLLAASPHLSFTELRDTLNLTDGNLTAHARTLQEAGYVAVTKTFEGARPLTTFSLTTKGARAFTAYIDLLERTPTRRAHAFGELMSPGDPVERMHPAIF